MCTRYRLERIAEVNQLVRDIFGVTLPADYSARYNVAPSQVLPLIVINEENKPEISLMKWGLLHAHDRSLKPDHVNLLARSESVLQKFRSPAQKRRCLGIADGFYDFETAGETKVPHLFTLDDSRPFFFAAIFEPSNEVLGRPPTWAMLSMDANSKVAAYNDRMPVILEADAARRWVSPGEMTGDLLKTIIQPVASERMSDQRVSRLLNNSRNDFKEAAEPEPSLFG